ncbi:MAG: glycosyltransferase [Bacteroidales bacterium]|nr:glycosyltransferase [Bacteroidales bacterium]
MKISYIIPVYKAEKYLCQCVASLTCQTYKDIEIILVNDGSPDNSPALCDQLALEDSRIRVIHKQNGGAASARNVGLNNAEGEYIIFCDADDFWRSDTYLEELAQKAESHPECDFINFNCSYYYGSNGQYRDFAPFNDKLLLPVEKNELMVKLVESGTFSMSPCTKIIKRSFLFNNKILFPEGTTAEDIPWFIQMIDNCNSSMFCNDYQYAYRQEVATSVTHKRGGVNYLLGIVENGVKDVEQLSLNADAKDALRSFYAYELCILLAGYPKADSETKLRIGNLLWLLDYRLHPKVARVGRLKDKIGLYLTIRVLCLYNWYRSRYRI